MDPASPPGRTAPVDCPALRGAAEELGRRPGESRLGTQDAIVFSENCTDPGSAFGSRPWLDPAAGEGAAGARETSPGGPAGPPGAGGDGPASGVSPGKDAAAQALFWAGILQAQLCMLDLQGELEKQDGAGQALSGRAGGPPAVPDSPGWPAPREESDDGQEAGPGRPDEEEEEEEEEEQCLFYTNPLFQASPPAAGPAFWQDAERDGAGSTEGEDGLPEGGRREGEEEAGGSPAEPGAEEEAAEPEPEPCAVPVYTVHRDAWGPLASGGGDGAEDTEALGCPHDQLADGALCRPPVLLESGLSGAGDQLEGGLLFSASGTSVISALLREQAWIRPGPCEDRPPPPPPGGGPRSPPASPPHPAQPAPCQEWDVGRPPPGRGSPPPPSPWAEASRSAPCPRGEVAEPDSPGEAAGKPCAGAEEPGTEELPPLPGDEAPPPGEGGPEAGPGRPVEEEAGEKPGDPEAAASAQAVLANGASGEQEAAQRLAARLYRLDGVKRSQVASYLRKNNEFSRLVAEQYLSFFQFSGQTLDRALRSFLKAFVLTGETQERERILGHFSARYHRSNPDAFPSADAVHTLTCALMLLNTDLHGQNIGHSMTCHEFVANLDGMSDGQSFPKDQLKGLYSSIRNEKLEWALDEEAQDSPPTPRPPSTPSSRKKSNPFLNLACDPKATTYKQGLLTRKVHAEADGKKTPWGKRGWKTFHTVLKGMVLYFLKDEGRLEAPGGEEPIGVHHALAERAAKYHKRPHVFRLQTADWGVFLFQALNAEEMNSWISRINLVAAMFSSPPFPAAVGSQRRFIRPILPTAQCRSSLEDQHQAHESWMDKFSDELGEHQRNLPDKRGRGRDLEEYRLKKEYLLHEKRRYETYVRLLEARLRGGAEPLEQWEARLGAQDSADEGPGLTKSHSSPSLNLDPPPAGGGVRVKRNISERRTVRKIIPKRNKHLL